MAMIRLGTMPPEDGDSIDSDTRKKMADLIDELANAVNCVRNPNAGKVALRRLNRAEYRNTVRDLTLVDYTPATGFPGDDVGYGFDNIGDVLSLPPILIEKYLDAAERISGKAIYTAPPAEIFELNKVPSSLIGAEKFGNRNGRLTLASQGTVSLQVDLPFGGDVTLTITASGDQGGGDPVRMELVAGRKRQVIDVPNDEPVDFKNTFRLGKGTRSFEISFINDYYVKDKIDRNLHIHHVHVRAQQRRARTVSSDRLPESHKKLIFVTPDVNVSDQKATRAVLGRLASRAYRRPASDEEISRLSDLAQQVRDEGGTFDESIQVALQAILVSPHFLFKVEQPRGAGPDGRMPPISQYELATRVSYFLWSSMPDDELLLMAHQGKMRGSNSSDEESRVDASGSESESIRRELRRPMAATTKFGFSETRPVDLPRL